MAYFEWDIETVDASTGEVLDHRFSDTCPGIPTEENTRLVLVREDANGFRSWAYYNEETNEFDVFRNAYGEEVSKVPKKYLKKFKQSQNNLDCWRKIISKQK